MDFEVTSLQKPALFLCIQMELCDMTLKEYMMTKIYHDNHTTRLSFWYGLINAVHHLHGYNIVHRDIKPSNIFFKDGIIKLADFGLACQNINNITSKKSIDIGCSYYRAPEIDSGYYNSSIDIYSVGIILIELLLQYNTMYEKDQLISSMLKTKELPKLMINIYNDLIVQMISIDSILRPNTMNIIKKIEKIIL